MVGNLQNGWKHQNCAHTHKHTFDFTSLRLDIVTFKSHSILGGIHFYCDLLKYKVAITWRCCRGHGTIWLQRNFNWQLIEFIDSFIFCAIGHWSYTGQNDDIGNHLQRAKIGIKFLSPKPWFACPITNLFVNRFSSAILRTLNIK